VPFFPRSFSWPCTPALSKNSAASRPSATRRGISESEASEVAADVYQLCSLCLFIALESCARRSTIPSGIVLTATAIFQRTVTGMGAGEFQICECDFCTLNVAVLSSVCECHEGEPRGTKLRACIQNMAECMNIAGAKTRLQQQIETSNLPRVLTTMAIKRW
jgi:hypothetical protein